MKVKASEYLTTIFLRCKPFLVIFIFLSQFKVFNPHSSKNNVAEQHVFPLYSNIILNDIKRLKYKSFDVLQELKQIGFWINTAKKVEFKNELQRYSASELFIFTW